MIVLHPENERSLQIKDLLSRLYTERAKVMDVWKPKKDTNVVFCTYDFEYFDEMPTRVPYSFGIYGKAQNKMTFEHKELYVDYLGTENIISNFVKGLATICDEHIEARREYVYDD